MTDLKKLLRDVAADPVLRRAFAESPQTVLRARGLDPHQYDFPDKIDVAELEKRLGELEPAPEAAPVAEEKALPAPESAPAPAPAPPAPSGIGSRCGHRLGHRPEWRAESAPQPGILSNSQPVPPLVLAPPAPERTESGGAPLAGGRHQLRQVQESGAVHPPAWFGSNGTAVSRALITGTSPSGPTAETIMASDDRVQITNTAALPFRWLARLVIRAANGTLWSGTAWFAGPRVLITAGHCVFMQNQGGWVNDIDVYLYDRQGRLVGPVDAHQVTSVTEWTGQGNTEHDYGAIFLGADIPYSPGYLGFGSFANQDLQAAVANIAGFPVDKPVSTLWGSARRVARVEPNALYYEIDTYGGMSGAPVVCWTGQDYIAVGIHNYGDLAGNRATRINTGVYMNLQAWLDESIS